MTDYDTAQTQKILTVTELNRLARQLLESSLPLFWVSGEVSNFTRAASGHWYFSLKDTNAQVRCVMFKGRNSHVDFMPSEGDKVEARASVTLYEARGDFQLTVEFVQKAGLGALFETFEKLKAKLSHEGLFDPRFKKQIPTHPKAIGIVTSPDAAALRDVLTTLKRRNPSIPVIIYPTPVQGKSAPALIAQAIQTAQQRQEVDTLIICRGGGSLEDLWSFNEEIVARAIDECTIPTICGVGHETDVTIADFVADLRAATPTAAAELACMDVNLLKNQLMQRAGELQKQMEHGLNRHAQTLDYLSRRLISPLQRIEHQTLQLKQWQHRLQRGMHQQMQSATHKLLRLSSNLQQLNPQNVLARGYAMVQNSQGEIITQSTQLTPQQSIRITLQSGEIGAQVLNLTHTAEHSA